jgi:hypothetical protein
LDNLAIVSRSRRDGRPTNRVTGANGDETWTYLYNKVDVNPATFLPVVGVFALTTSGTPYQNQTLTLTFRNQLLASCKFVLISGTAQSAWTFVTRLSTRDRHTANPPALRLPESRSYPLLSPETSQFEEISFADAIRLAIRSPRC